jgi:hypothetical protein
VEVLRRAIGVVELEQTGNRTRSVNALMPGAVFSSFRPPVHLTQAFTIRHTLT